MPPQIAALIEKATAYFKDLFANVVIIYGEKGIEPFKRPLIIAVPSLLILYAGIYSPISGKLSKTVNSSAKTTGVSVESQSAQRETEIGSYLVVSREVSTVTTYHKMGKWLAEIENSPIFLVITDPNMERMERSEERR